MIQIICIEKDLIHQSGLLRSTPQTQTMYLQLVGLADNMGRIMYETAKAKLYRSFPDFELRLSVLEGYKLIEISPSKSVIKIKGFALKEKGAKNG